MNSGNLKESGAVAERVSFALKNGDKEMALQILEQSFGSTVRNLLENVMKYSNLNMDDLGRAFSKISDYLENAAARMDKNERMQEKKDQIAELSEQEKDAASIAALNNAAAERQQQFEERLQWLENERKRLKEQKKQLEMQRKQEKDTKKRKEIEEKLKKLEERRKHLDTERQKLQKLQKQNKTRNYSDDNANDNNSKTQESENKTIAAFKDETQSSLKNLNQQER